MTKRFLFIAFFMTIVSVPLADCWAFGRGRGGGGGSRGGGGGFGSGGFSGGGFSGGASRGGGFSGGARPSPSYGGGRPMSQPNFGGGMGAGTRPSQGNAGAINRSPGGLGGGVGAGAISGQRPAGGAGNLGLGSGNFGLGGQGGANRFNAPSQRDLNGFLGLPSDEGFGHASSGAMSRPSQLPSGGGNFDVNYGSKEGPRGGQVGGVSVTGPGGNTAGRVAAVGPNGGAAVAGGIQGAGGGTAARGAAVGPNGGAAVAGGVRGPGGGTAARGAAVGPGGQVIAGRGAVGPGGYGGGSVIAAGPGGVAAGFTRVTLSGRYTAAAAVRSNYNNWGVYGRGWYAQYPGAWVAAGLTASALWNASTWGTASAYCGYTEVPPIYYDYGNSVVYDDSNVYINGDNAGTAEQYYDQAVSLATTSAQTAAPTEGDWLPLGVFAFTKLDQQKSDITIQLAVNKQGIIRGNYTDTATKQNQVVQGSIDKETQRAAFTVGDNKTSVIETGLYNLTKDEAPCLLHLGKESTEQWLLVRLNNPEPTT